MATRNLVRILIAFLLGLLVTGFLLMWLGSALGVVSRHGLEVKPPWAWVGLAIATALSSYGVYVGIGHHRRAGSHFIRIARLLNGRFVEGGLWDGHKIRTERGAWILTFDHNAVDGGNAPSTTFTRIRAPYIKKAEFTFRLVPARLRAGMYDAAAHHRSHPLGRQSVAGWEALGTIDAPTGDPLLDSRFVLCCTDVPLAQRLLGNCSVRSALDGPKQDLFFSNVPLGNFPRPGEGKLPPGVGLVTLDVREVTSEDDVICMHQLVEATLNELCRLEIISAERPSLVL